MTETPHKYAPVSPYLMVDNGAEALNFYRRAFGAEVIETYPHEEKLGHATLTINGGEVMLSDEFPEDLTGVRSPKSLAERPAPFRSWWMTRMSGSTERSLLVQRLSGP